MKLKTIFIAAAAAIGGIYLTSVEGKKAREALRKKKTSFEPIIKSLIKDANKILDGSKDVQSDAIKANVKLLASKAKKILLDIDLEEAMETIQEAIKVASKKIRLAANEKQDSIKAKPINKKASIRDTQKIKTKKSISKI